MLATEEGSILFEGKDTVPAIQNRWASYNNVNLVNTTELYA